MIRKLTLSFLALQLGIVLAAGAWGRREAEPRWVEEPPPSPAPGGKAEPGVLGLQRAEGVRLRFAAMPVGSAWYGYASIFARLLEAALPRGSRVEVLPVGGGIANPQAVAGGKADIALSNAATARWAYEGMLMYEGSAMRNLRALAGGLSRLYAVVIFSRDFIQRTGLDSLEGVARYRASPRVLIRPEGTLAQVIAELLLEEYGLIPGSAIQASGEQFPERMEEGQADIWIDVVPPNHPSVTEGMRSGRLEIVGLGREAIQALGRFGLSAEVIAPGDFPGMAGPVPTVSPGTVILAAESLDEEVAYRITRAICEGRDEAARADESLAAFEPRLAWRSENIGVPLHPGASRFYREKGWMH